MTGKIRLRDELTALKRERIVDTAANLFKTHGYHGCSMEMIATALNVSKPFIYYQFRDKSELLVEICRKGADLSFSAARLATEAPGGAPERLHNFCRQLALIVRENDARISVYTRERINLPRQVRVELARERAEIDRLVAEIIQEGVASGHFKTLDPLIHARAITGMISFIHTWSATRSEMPVDIFCAFIADIAVRSIMA